MTQETLEELAKEFYSDENQLMERIAFKRGYTECKENSYSEEEVRNIANWAFAFYRRNDLSDSELEDEFNRILEEQFKKK